MPSEAGQYTNTYAFAGQVGDECAPPRVTAGARYARCAVQPEQVLGHDIGSKCTPARCDKLFYFKNY